MMGLNLLNGVGNRDLDFGEVASWPKLLKALCFALAATLAVLVAYGFALSDLRADLAAAERREQVLRGQLAVKQPQAAVLAHARTSSERAQADLAQLLRRLPGHAEVPGLIEDISAAAAANDLAIDRIELAQERAASIPPHGDGGQPGPRPAGAGAPYVELPIAIVVRGGYHQLGAFVATIGALEQLVTLHDFALTSEDADNLVLAITAKTYRHLDDLGEEPPAAQQARGLPAPAAYASTDLRSPFQAAAGIRHDHGSAKPPDFERAKTPLEHFALDELRMVGTLAGRNATRALLRDPQGRIHALRVGDHLGRDHGRVTAVYVASVDVIEIVRQGRQWLQRPRVIALAAANNKEAENDP